MTENLNMSENLPFCEQFENFRDIDDPSEDTNQGPVKSFIINGDIITLNPNKIFDCSKYNEFERISLQIEEIKNEIKKKCEKAYGETSVKKGQSYIKKFDDLQIKQKFLENEKENLINNNKIKHEATILSKDKNESNNFVPYSQPFETINLMNSDFSDDENTKFTHEQCCDKKNDVCISNDSDENESNAIDYEEEIIYDVKTEKTNYQIFMDFLLETLSSAIISIVSYINGKSDFKLLAIYDKAEFRIISNNYKRILKGTIKDIYLSEFWEVSSKKDFVKKNSASIESLLKNEREKEKIPKFKFLFDKKIKEVYKNYLINTNLIDFGNFKAFIGMKTIKNDKKYNNYNIKLIEKIVNCDSSSQFPINIKDKIKNLERDLVIEINNSIYDSQFKYTVNNGNIITLTPTSVIEPNTSTKKKNKKIKIKNTEGSSVNDTLKKLSLEIEETNEIGKQSHDEIWGESEQNYIKTNDFQVKQESLDKAKNNLINKNEEEQEKMDLSQYKYETPKIEFNSCDDIISLKGKNVKDCEYRKYDISTKSKEKFLDKKSSKIILNDDEKNYLFKTLSSAIKSLVDFTIKEVQSKSNKKYILENICEEKKYAITNDNYEKILDANVCDIFVGKF